MKKRCEICFGSCRGYKDSTVGKRYKAYAEIELRYDDSRERLTLSICGDIKTHPGGYSSCGQCLDRIDEVSDDFIPAMRKLWKQVYRLWKNYHLNDMHAGTPEQETALKEYKAQTGKTYLDYSLACAYLQSRGLYTVKLEDGTDYSYGSGWLYEEIPTEDINLINSLIGVFA